VLAPRAAVAMFEIFTAEFSEFKRWTVALPEDAGLTQGASLAISDPDGGAQLLLWPGYQSRGKNVNRSCTPACGTNVEATRSKGQKKRL